VRFPRHLTALVVLTAFAMTACGGGNTGTGSSGEPTASAPEATAPPPDATQPGTGPVTTPTTTTPRTTQTQPAAPDDGGEQQVRVPASFVVTAGGRLTPPTITVPPFLAVEISIRADDGRSHRLVLQTQPSHALQVGAGQRAAVRIRGLRAGRYAVTLDGRRAGALVAGGEVGP
jgi:predicted small secreted protein